MFKDIGQKWELETIFTGGSHSPEFEEFLKDLQKRVQEFAQSVSGLESSISSQELESLIGVVNDIDARLDEALAFAGCLMAQNVQDKRAKILHSKISQVEGKYQGLLTRFDDLLVNLSDQRWEELFATPDLRDLRFVLEERRADARQKLPAEQEELVKDLETDGYHAWYQLYHQVVGRMTISTVIDGKQRDMSVGQAHNMLSESKRSVRANVFAQIEHAWGENAELCASALNHLAGFRINLYHKRNWGSILKEPLYNNRVSEKTIWTMWECVENGKGPLVKYLEKKAELLEIPQMSWYDLDAPLSEQTSKIPYRQGAEFVVERLSAMLPDLGRLATKAITERWIESEDRAFKEPGGFCAGFPLSGQSRIFMTYSGSYHGVSTLAHEIGHAYHGYVMNGLPQILRNYPMTLAETASTFAELVVDDGAIEGAKTDEDKLVLLDAKLQRTVALFMNIHARFLFENRFYKARRKGILEVAELNALMLEAQKDAYCDSLDCYHPLFWASKEHFYITDEPFYNFPYTFGFLFSNGVYALALESGPAFAERYKNLLRDSGRMSCEELAKKHLGVDITEPYFWNEAVRIGTIDGEKFATLVDKNKKR